MGGERLGDYAEIVMGQSPPGDSCNTNGVGAPLLNGPTEFGPLHPTPVQFTTDARKLARSGDILFCVRGSTTGRMNWADRTYAIGRGVAAIRHKYAEDLQPFVRAVIAYGVERLLQQATGSTFPNVSADQLAAIWWPPQSEHEQRAIGHILGSLDNKIELNRRTGETLEAIARVLFKSWFVRFDPARSSNAGDEPELSRAAGNLSPDASTGSALLSLPRGWRRGTLAELSTLNPERWSRETMPGAIAYVDLGSTKWGRIESIAEYSREEAPSRAQNILRKHDTIVGVVRPGNGSYAFVAQDGLTGSTGFAVLRPLSTEYAEFVYLAATAPENIERLAHLADGAAYPAVRPQVVAATTIALPPHPVIEAFSQVSSGLFARIAVCESESRTLAALRDTLLPKLISGELRIRDAERVVADVA